MPSNVEEPFIKGLRMNLLLDTYMSSSTFVTWTCVHPTAYIVYCEVDAPRLGRFFAPLDRIDLFGFHSDMWVKYAGSLYANNNVSV